MEAIRLSWELLFYFTSNNQSLPFEKYNLKHRNS